MATQGAVDADFVLPVGTVTLLLADVEGSTRLWENEPENMAAGMAKFDRVVSEAVGRHDGVRPVEQGEGDSFVAAFPRASDAVAAALELQRAETAPVAIRIGLHTGEVELRGEGNYIGLTVNRCARLRDLAHGGQTVLSQTTRDLVEEHLPPGSWLVDLGVHRLRDLARAEHISQLCHVDLPTEFPALRSLDIRPHNLPVQLTTFVGRRTELDEIVDAVRGTRLLTLTGSGGCGKTRLALHAGADLLTEVDDGVWFVELAPYEDPTLVPFAVTKALRLPDDGGQSTTNVIVNYLSTRNLLLILDNCEHLIHTCAELCETLLRSCPDIRIVATSREPLGVPGEVTWRVPSLGLPEENDCEPIVGVAHSEAVELFVERAGHAKPGFALTTDNVDAVGEICRRLDGIPLAIELAASRARVFTPTQIASRLNDRFLLLSGGARTAVPRQHTLRASVDWSHNLLTGPEQILFRRLAVFAGSFDFDAAEAVGAAEPLQAHQILDLLSLLVDKSLVTAVDAPAGNRYRLPETVRTYATEQLHDAGEMSTTWVRHRDHYLHLAKSTWKQYWKGDSSWVRQSDEADNLRVAFESSRAVSDVNDALSIVAFMYPTWMQSRAREGLSWLDEVIEDREQCPERIRVLVLSTSAMLCALSLDRDGRAHAQEALTLARGMGDETTLCHTINSAGWAHVNLSPVEAIALFEESVEMARRLSTGPLRDALAGLGTAQLAAGDGRARATLEEAAELERNTANHQFGGTATLVRVLVGAGDYRDARALANDMADRTAESGDIVRHGHALALASGAAARMGDRTVARDLAETSMAIARRAANPRYEAAAWLHLGIAELAAGDPARARTMFEHAHNLIGVGDVIAGRHTVIGLAEAELGCADVDAARRHLNEILSDDSAPNRWYHAGALTLASRLALREGQTTKAEDLCHKALRLRQQRADKAGIAEALELLAILAVRSESHVEAARLFGAAESARDAIGSARFAIYDDAYESSVAAMREAIPNDVDSAWAEGAAMSPDDAVTYAARGRGERKRPSAGWESLTPAEQNIARLVAEGLDNQSIAERLFVSARTVQSHLTHIYTKLGVRTRVALANEALRRH